MMVYYDINFMNVGSKEESKRNTPHKEEACAIEGKTDERFLNRIYEIKISDVMGRYVVAKSDLPAGTIVLEEDPLVIGPTQNSSPMCISCYLPIQSSNHARCDQCNWPLCKKNCETMNTNHGHRKEECDILKESKTERTSLTESLYNILTPLRILLLKKENESSWNIIKSMEDHKDWRKKSDQWKSDEVLIDFFKNNLHLTFITEDEIHSICGFIQVNGFGIEGREVTGLYPSAFLLSHDCIPNTTHTIHKNYHMVLRTTKNINKGELLTISYCNTLHGTLWRREHILGSKFFNCSCKRCSDKTELNTWMSGVKCEKCESGYLLQNDPLDNSSFWECEKCSSSKTKKEVYDFVNRIFEISEKLNNNIDEMEEFLKKHEKYLHPNHFLLLSIKLKLSQLYGKTQEYMIYSMEEHQLKRKIELCKDVLRTFNVIEPGLSRIRGITLYELHAPVLILATNEFKKSNNKKKFKQELNAVKCYLSEASKILNIEDPESAEGLIGKAATNALQQMEN